MGTWKVDAESELGVLRMKLSGTLTVDEMRAYVVACQRAVESCGGHDYRVFVDLTELMPLSPECAALQQQLKEFSCRRRNFRGSAVLVSSALIALQHRRTSIDSGLMPTEMISDDLAALRKHLRSVYRVTW